MRRIGYLFSNGKKRFYFKGEAVKRAALYCEEEDCYIVEEVIEGMPQFVKVGQVRGDNVIEGWNPGLGEYVKGKSHYKQLCKEKGLEPIGKEKANPRSERSEGYFNEESIREMAEMGADISDMEAKRLMESDE